MGGLMIVPETLVNGIAQGTFKGRLMIDWLGGRHFWGPGTVHGTFSTANGQSINPSNQSTANQLPTGISVLLPINQLSTAQPLQKRRSSTVCPGYTCSKVDLIPRSLVEQLYPIAFFVL